MQLVNLPLYPERRTKLTILIRLIPIASVLSPASLTSEIRTLYEETMCPIATLDFTQEALYNFRDKTDYPGYSLAYYNTTDINATQEGWFDYYDQPSKNARRLAVTTAYLKKPAQRARASYESCGRGWNCTYSFNFTGPGYMCEEVASTNASIANALGAPFDTSILAPYGDLIYNAVVDDGDYLRPQLGTKDNGTPQDGPPYPELFGVFQSEPEIWIGYSKNTSMPYHASDPLSKIWGNVHEPQIFRCISYHTQYAFNMTFRDTNQ